MRKILLFDDFYILEYTENNVRFNYCPWNFCNTIRFYINSTYPCMYILLIGLDDGVRASFVLEETIWVIDGTSLQSMV